MMRSDPQFGLRVLALLLALAVPLFAGGQPEQEKPSAPAAAVAPTYEKIPDLEPRWPASFPATVDGRYGLIRQLDAPRGFTSGLPRDRELDEELKALLEPHANLPIRTINFEGPNAFGYRPIRPGERTRRPPTGYPSLTFQYLSGELFGLAFPSYEVTIQRTWFAVFDPTEGVPPRGIALIMPGIFGTPEPIFAGLSAALQQDGWTVLRMMAQPSRFTERMTWPIRLDDAERRASTMDHIARTITARAAECAYAARAAMEHLLEQRPELAGLPRIAIGGSGGAMTLPTVLALEPEKYAAAIMIAGGADFFTMNIQSNYQQMIGAVEIEWITMPPGGAPSAEQFATLPREYLSRSSLDSYHTAIALRGKPVLMIHGTRDLAVPAHLGDLLWERLGRPERWAQEAGHEEIFMHLPQQIDGILEWIRGAVAATAESR
jgi:fermentation-respiration switch protein FrsA (DUF1100 family)